MSSSRDAGAAAETASKIRDSWCPKSTDGSHVWDEKGSWPSRWGVCQHCGVSWFSK